MPPALTLVLTFRPLGFLFGLLLAFVTDFGLFMTGSLKDALCELRTIQTCRRRVSHLLVPHWVPPALTLVLTFRLFGSLFGLLLAFVTDFGLFMSGSR